jgi:Holliday junction resolvasome RuvABC endonuclease subunit
VSSGKLNILAIDPASQVTGYAVLAGLQPDELLDGGLIRASEASGLVSDHQAVCAVADHLRLPELKHYRRCRSIIVEVCRLIGEHEPALIAVEIPSGLVGTGARRGASGSLTTYGLAAGMILEACVSACGGDAGRVLPVTERQWTARLGSKRRRQQDIADRYGRRYPTDRDPGGDLADAIGLGRWAVLRFHPQFIELCRTTDE